MTDDQLASRITRLETQVENLIKLIDEMKEDSRATRHILETIEHNGWKNIALLSGVAAVVGGVVTKVGTWLVSIPVK